MMVSIDFWPVAAVLAALAFLASLRQSVPGIAERQWIMPLNLITHPTWLLPLIFILPMIIGYMMTGSLSPWPPEAGDQLTRRWGHEAGITGYLLVLTAALWLLWTPSIVLRRFSKEHSADTFRVMIAVNLLLGALFFTAVHFIVG